MLNVLHLKKISNNLFVFPHSDADDVSEFGSGTLMDVIGETHIGFLKLCVTNKILGEEVTCKSELSSQCTVGV